MVDVAISFRPDAVLLTTASATGLGVTIQGGDYNWNAWGTWNGATAQLQWSPDAGTTWLDISGAALTANGGWTRIPIARGKVRVAISGAGGSTSISSSLGGIA